MAEANEGAEGLAAKTGVALQQAKLALHKTDQDIEQAEILLHAFTLCIVRGLQLTERCKPRAQELDEVLEPAVQLLESMGFDRDQAVKCLIEADGDLDRAVAIMVTQNNEEDSLPMETPAAQSDGWNHLSQRELYQRIGTIQYFASMPRLNDAQQLKNISSSERTMSKHFGKDDFSWTLNFSPAFYHAMCLEGMLPICSKLGSEGPFVVMPKHHMERCVVCTDGGALAAFASSASQKSKFRLTVDTCFEAVIAGCINQHGESWLHHPIQSIMKTIIESKPANGTITTMELWQGDDLVAGEVGFSAGAIYTSFSGFFTVSGSGRAQMQQTAQCLLDAGFSCWDLGQELPYKKSMLGATLMPRADFYDLYRRDRSLTPSGDLAMTAVMMGIQRDAIAGGDATVEEPAETDAVLVTRAWQHAVAVRAEARQRLLDREQLVELEPSEAVSSSTTKKIAKVKRRMKRKGGAPSEGEDTNSDMA